MMGARGAGYAGRVEGGRDHLERGTRAGARAGEHGRARHWLGVTPAGRIRVEEQRHNCNWRTGWR
jgi:hypothetical protein